MGQVTGIEWCDHTYNPWMGCTKVSPVCDHCYAEAQEDARYGRVEWGGSKQLAVPFEPLDLRPWLGRGIDWIVVGGETGAKDAR